VLSLIFFVSFLYQDKKESQCGEHKKPARQGQKKKYKPPYMPKIFTEDDLKLAWQLYRKGYRLKVCAEIMQCTKEEANAIVTAAYRRWGRGPRLIHDPPPQPQKQQQEEKPFVRPKAEYSNRSYH
jgi:hypothetical protein